MSKIEYTVYDTATGEVVSIGSLSYASQLELVKKAGQEVIEEKADWDQYVNLTTLALETRPTVLAPSANYDLTQLPAGTVVTVTNEAGDELIVTDLTEPLVLSDPGEYGVNVEPPFPYLKINAAVEVS